MQKASSESKKYMDNYSNYLVYSISDNQETRLFSLWIRILFESYPLLLKRNTWKIIYVLFSNKGFMSFKEVYYCCLYFWQHIIHNSSAGFIYIIHTSTDTPYQYSCRIMGVLRLRFYNTLDTTFKFKFLFPKSCCRRS